MSRLPTILFLGIFAIVRLVESALESMQYLTGIARIRGYYRTLGPEAARLFALTWLFYLYQRWRFADFDTRARERGADPGGIL